VLVPSYLRLVSIDELRAWRGISSEPRLVTFARVDLRPVMSPMIALV
jgi:hypothetical protein